MLMLLLLFQPLPLILFAMTQLLRKQERHYDDRRGIRRFTIGTDYQSVHERASRVLMDVPTELHAISTITRRGLTRTVRGHELRPRGADRDVRFESIRLVAMLIEWPCPVNSRTECDSSGRTVCSEVEAKDRRTTWRSACTRLFRW